MTYEEQITERKVAAAAAQADEMKRQRDEARAELAKVKAAVSWCMEKGIISSLFNSASMVQIPPGGPLPADEDDRARLDYVNQHGCVWLADRSFCFSVPFEAHPDDVTVPEIYNIRHLLDVCRGAWLKPDENKEVL